MSATQFQLKSGHSPDFNMRKQLLVGAAAIAAMFAPLAFAQDAETRPEWDQQKAVALVQKVIALEATESQPWDKIAWLTDVDKAVARAQKENKPIFLYFSVVKGGPATAPC
jgi:hypothetical protein